MGPEGDVNVQVARLDERVAALAESVRSYIEENRTRASADRAETIEWRTQTMKIVEKLDERQDSIDHRLTKLLTGVSIAVSFGFLVVQIVAPYILHAIGAPGP